MLKWNVFFSGLMLISLYYFLFPQQMEGELSVVPDKLVPVGMTSKNISIQNIIASIKNDERVFFVDKNHEVFSASANENSTVASQWFSEFKNDRLSIVYPDGRIRRQISEKGFPIAVDNNLFFYREDLGSLSMLNPENGQLLWRREFLSPLTALDSSGGQTLACFLNGEAILFNKERNPIALYHAQDSRVNAIYGGAIANNGNIALLSGLEPQRIQVLQYREKEFESILEVPVEEERRDSTSIGFVDNGTFLLYEDAGKIVRMNVNDSSVENLNIPGKLSGWFEDKERKRLNFFGTIGSQKFLRSFSFYGGEYWDITMSLKIENVEQVGRYMLLVTDEAIAFLRIEVI